MKWEEKTKVWRCGSESYFVVCSFDGINERRASNRFREIIPQPDGSHGIRRSKTRRYENMSVSEEL